MDWKHLSKFQFFDELEDISNLNFKITEKAVFKKIFDIGIPSALQMLFEVGIFTAAIWLSGTLGKIYQAANQIAFNLSAITLLKRDMGTLCVKIDSETF